MKTTNAFLKLCTALCLLAGIVAFGAGCGDDNNSSGDDCPSGQVKASINNGPEQCYEACETATDCSEANATCNGGVCIGGGTNNDTDAGNNDTDGGGDDDAGLQCGTDEVAANPFGEGEACYATCTDSSTCSGAEECLELNDGSMACIEIPTGDLTCAELFNCTSSCTQGDTACQNACYFDATADAQDANDAFNTCFADNCGDAGQDEVASCVQTNCSAEINTCADCDSGDVDLTRGFGFECTTECTEGGGECAADETCQSPILSESTEMFCAHDMSALADACSGNADCPTPDVAGGQPFCVTESQQAAYVGGYCLAAGCDVGPSGQNYGLSSGCGLDAICIEQSDGAGGTVGLCLPLCSTVEDCRDTDLASYTCSILQVTGTTPVGTCDPACSDDSDCTRGEGADAVQGRCNAKSYCEYPCADDGSCTQAGGTCDSEDFCVFETAAN